MGTRPKYKPRHGFKRPSIVPKSWERVARIEYHLKGIWRSLRINRHLTALLGSQYKRSRDMIEIDITYRCNLNCCNCNRSVRQAPEAIDISLLQIEAFVFESIERKIMWKRIRVLGGEPTLHPQFIQIIDTLEKYTSSNKECEIQVVTNGYGEKVNSMLDQLPKHIWVENSNKKGSWQPDFAPFNMAPCDNPLFKNSDYANGCAIMEECGMGLTPMGYYPCAVAGGIDRIAGIKLGYSHIPDCKDDMSAILKEMCQYCGRFSDGHYIPKNIRNQVVGEPISPSWQVLYDNWKRKKTAAK